MNQQETVTFLHYAKTLGPIQPDVESIPKCAPYTEPSDPPPVIALANSFLCPRCDKTFTIEGLSA